MSITHEIVKDAKTQQRERVARYRVKAQALRDWIVEGKICQTCNERRFRSLRPVIKGTSIVLNEKSAGSVHKLLKRLMHEIYDIRCLNCIACEYQ